MYQVEFSRALGAALKRRRKRRHWTREELVHRMESLACNKVSANTIAAYEHGTRAMYPVRLVELCDALDIPAAHILDEVYQAPNLKTDHQITIDLRARSHLPAGTLVSPAMGAA